MDALCYSSIWASGLTDEHLSPPDRALDGALGQASSRARSASGCLGHLAMASTSLSQGQSLTARQTQINIQDLRSIKDYDSKTLAQAQREAGDPHRRYLDKKYADRKRKRELKEAQQLCDLLEKRLEKRVSAYGIPYYWNRDNGESAWEWPDVPRPAAQVPQVPPVSDSDLAARAAASDNRILAATQAQSSRGVPVTGRPYTPAFRHVKRK